MPIPTLTLFLLSIRTRQRALEQIEAQLLFHSARPGSIGSASGAAVAGGAAGSQADINNPGMIETYARLLYTSPYS
jgi:hypothetical protein